uniref:E3 ubiquitin-protein ligase E3D n=1 Tax=Plectus sambesii TaxID=2011161 RepID=A0A914WFA6_9BILA
MTTSAAFVSCTFDRNGGRSFNGARRAERRWTARLRERPLVVAAWAMFSEKRPTRPATCCVIVSQRRGRIAVRSRRPPPPQPELVKVGEHELELGDRTVDANQLDVNSRHKFVAGLADLCLYPNTICGLTWADHRRLFMCKVHAEPEGLPLVPKTFHRLARDIKGTTCLDEYVFDARTAPIDVTCVHCDQRLFTDTTGECELVALPEDDWLDTAPSMEYFCGDSHQCGRRSPNRPATPVDRSRWLPSASPTRVVLAESFSDTSVFQLYHSVTNFRTDLESPIYLSLRFGSHERYYAWLLMSQCEAQSSLKLVVRSIDRRPHLLIWLLESYVVLTNGDLREAGVNGVNGATLPTDATHSFPALKMLYKVFDAESAASDPRATGQDASVGLVDQPHGSCLRLTEILLSSSHALPPACRSVGQFYVGFLKLGDSIA